MSWAASYGLDVNIIQSNPQAQSNPYPNLNNNKKFCRNEITYQEIPQWILQAPRLARPVPKKNKAGVLKWFSFNAHTKLQWPELCETDVKTDRQLHGRE